jgi:hypothetical protein
MVKVDGVRAPAREVVICPGVPPVVGRCLLGLGDDLLALGVGRGDIPLVLGPNLLVLGQTATRPLELDVVALARVPDEQRIGRDDAAPDQAVQPIGFHAEQICRVAQPQSGLGTELPVLLDHMARSIPRAQALVDRGLKPLDVFAPVAIV